MNKILQILLFCFLFFTPIVKGQSTWIKTLNLDIFPSIHNDTTTVGPIEMVVRPDNKIWMLYQSSQDHETEICLIDSAGNLLFRNNVGIYGTTYSEDCFSLHPTSDNGCVFVKRHHLWGMSVSETVFRLNSVGSTLWTMTFNSFLFTVSYIAPTYSNTFLIVYLGDSLKEFDNNGTLLRTRVSFGGNKKIIPLIDSTFISFDASEIIKEDFTGNQNWNISASGFTVSTANMSFIYTRSQNHVMKLNTPDGTNIWTKPIVNDAISVTSDEGFIAIHGDTISKYDSSGTLQWYKDIQFSTFGIKGAVEVNPKTYILGGSYRYVHLGNSSLGSNPFMASLDSSGNGIIDTTDFFFMGNANDNTELTFGDDAVYVAAAMNNTGSARDTLLQGGHFRSVYATNWQGSFNNGINYKYSDADGNGIIDTDDLWTLTLGCQICNFSISPHWRNKTNSEGAPELRFSFENHNLFLPDTIKINVILGSQSVPVDSIYGISFDLGMNISPPGSLTLSPSYSIAPTALGDTSTNLFSFYSTNSGLMKPVYMVLCRTDHNNVFVAGDTIARLNYIVPDSSNFTVPVRMYVHWSAITADGFPVNLNLITDSLFISTVGIDRNDGVNFNVSPVPADDQVEFLFSDNVMKEIIIVDNTGRSIASFRESSTLINLNVKNYPAGIYYASIISGNRISRTKILIVH